MADVPASLKAIKPYLEQAKREAADPIVAYHCRLYALQEAMALRSKIPKDDMGYVIGLMDQLEAEKQTLGENDAPAVVVENLAQDLFARADDADRGGQSTLPTAKGFLAAAHLFEVCKQFGELPADLLEKIKYAKWRFVEICKATKERRPPAPPRGIVDDDEAGPSDGGVPPMPPAPGFAGPADAPPPMLPPGGGACDGAADYMGLPPAAPPGAVPPGPPNVPTYVSLDPPGAYPAMPPAPPAYDAAAALPFNLPAAPPSAHPPPPPPPPYGAQPAHYAAPGGMQPPPRPSYTPGARPPSEPSPVIGHPPRRARPRECLPGCLASPRTPQARAC